MISLATLSSLAPLTTGPDGNAAAGIMALGCFVWAIIMVVVFAILGLQIWMLWRTFAKAGYNGAMALLVLIPGIGIFIVLGILAFGNWPIHRNQAPH